MRSRVLQCAKRASVPRQNQHSCSVATSRFSVAQPSNSRRFVRHRASLQQHTASLSTHNSGDPPKDKDAPGPDSILYTGAIDGADSDLDDDAPDYDSELDIDDDTVTSEELERRVRRRELADSRLHSAGRIRPPARSAQANTGPSVVSYTTSNDPDEVEKAGTYFKVPETDLRKHFPEGVAGYLKHEFDYAGLRDLRAIMHREPAKTIISQVKAVAANEPGAQRAFMIRGVRGSGKSSALNHVVHFARSTGWIVVFVPRGRDMITKGLYCVPTTAGPDGMFDTPVNAQQLMVNLLAAHGPQLQELIVTDEPLVAQYGAHASGPDGSLTVAEGALTVEDIAKPGLPVGDPNDEENIESDAFAAAEEAADACFRAMLGQLMTTTSAKVMLAVDEYSELFQPSHFTWALEETYDEVDLNDPYYDEIMYERAASRKIQRINAERLTVVEPFLAFRPVRNEDGTVTCDPKPHTPRNGMVMVACTENYPPARKVKNERGLWPRFEETFGNAAEPWTVRTPRRYTSQEFWASVDHYKECDMIDPDEVSLEMLQRIAVKTALNPKLVFHKCSFKSHG